MNISNIYTTENYFRIKIYSDHKIYYDKHSRRHRTDGPAEEWSDGSKRWVIHGTEHRVGSFSFINTAYDIHYTHWRRNAFLHRLNAPAKIGGDLEHPEFWQFGVKIT
jgi:hypothetical protein